MQHVSQLSKENNTHHHFNPHFSRSSGLAAC